MNSYCQDEHLTGTRFNYEVTHGRKVNPGLSTGDILSRVRESSVNACTALSEVVCKGMYHSLRTEAAAPLKGVG